MKIASVAEVKARLSSYLKASAAGPVVVTRNGKAVAVLLGVDNDDELERLLFPEIARHPRRGGPPRRGWGRNGSRRVLAAGRVGQSRS
jgi:prevent-host-death family protein